MLNNTESKNTLYSLIFELSDGYFFIDQLLPYFNFKELQNLFLTCKHIAELVSKQRHVDYLVVFNNGLASYSKEHRNRWYNHDDDSSRNGFPSMMHFANGIRVIADGEREWLFLYIIDYCKKVNKVLNITYDKFIYNGDKSVVIDLEILKNTNDFGLIKTSQYNPKSFLPAFVGKNVKKIELPIGYCYSDFIADLRPILDPINFREILFTVASFSSFTGIFEYLSKLDSDFLNKIRILLEYATVSSREIFYSMQKYSKYLEYGSVIFEDPPKFSGDEFCGHKFDLFSKSITLSSKSLVKIEELALPKFSNTKPTVFNMRNIELVLDSANINTLHVLYTTSYLTEMRLDRCKINFSGIRKIEFESLNRMVLNDCTFLNNGNQSNVEFIECVQAPNLRELRCSNLFLQTIPMSSPSITTLALNNNEIVCIELEKLGRMKELTSLDLSFNKLNNLKSVQSIFGTFKHLKLTGNPVLESLMIHNNSLELISNDNKSDVKRSSKVEAKPKFSGTDMEIYKLLKSLIMNQARACYYDWYSREDFHQFIKNPKKLTSLKDTNVIFWNTHYSNNQKSISQEGNTTIVETKYNSYCQFAIYLNSELQYMHCRKWVFFGVNGDIIEHLDIDILKDLHYLVHEWSFMSSHIEFVKQLRKIYQPNYRI